MQVVFGLYRKNRLIVWRTFLNVIHGKGITNPSDFITIFLNGCSFFRKENTKLINKVVISLGMWIFVWISIKGNIIIGVFIHSLQSKRSEEHTSELQSR